MWGLDTRGVHESLKYVISKPMHATSFSFQHHYACTLNTLYHNLREGDDLGVGSWFNLASILRQGGTKEIKHCWDNTHNSTNATPPKIRKSTPTFPFDHFRLCSKYKRYVVDLAPYILPNSHESIFCKNIYIYFQ